jgi:CheY-like chemotaxis protein
MKILVVEDKPLQAQSWTAILGRHGHSVSYTNSGYGCLEHLEDDVPDCLIMDLVLPGMDGFDLLRSLRADRRYEKIPVVVTTGLTGDILLPLARDTLVEILTKPCTGNQVENAVARIAARIPEEI